MVRDKGPSPEAGDGVSAAAARAQIARILASPHFAKADRLRQFLAFVCEEALQGTASGVKETVIGIEVFDRPAATFDPRIDPIVRVQAGRVRAKLDAYYAEDGAGEAVLVELPKGQYVPRFSRREAASAGAAGAAGTAAAGGQANAIAVLPFANLSDDPANEYFSDGLTEELMLALARVPWLRVTARRSAFQFRERGSDIREIGRMLGAGKIVEGSVRKTDERLRITVQLVNVADGYQVWSEKYDRTTDDVLALQEEIAGAVGRALRGRLGEAGMLPATAPTTSVEAHNHYLWGRFHWNKRSAAGLRQGVAHFREAIQLDPHYGRAYSGLADCFIMLAISGTEPPLAVMPLARQAALRAVEIDERLVEAHTSLAVVRAIFDRDRRATELGFARALEADPSYATLHHWYSLYALSPEGRFGEAADEIAWAERLDPISLPINLGHAQVLQLADDSRGALAQCNKVLRLDPGYYRAHWFLGLAHDRLGDFAAAVDALETARRRSADEVAFGGRILGALGHAYGRWGKRERAIAIRDEMTAMARTGYLDRFELAQVHCGLGDTDAALAALEGAAEERSGYFIFCPAWPAFKSLRPLPRFQRLIERMEPGVNGAA